MTIWIRVLWCSATLLVFFGDVRAQSFNEDREELNVGINVGYNTWFRDGTWVPVEVLITNEQRDFDGHIEVRAYDFSGRPQSPIYRLPAQCPQNSRKRFVVNVFLKGAQRVEAWLYEGNRVAVDVPAYVQTQPIESHDLLTIVLDDEPENLGFMYAAVQRDDEVVRFHRFALPSSDANRLPEVAQAYRAFNAIILGDFEPDRVSTRHRRLIREYVESGGTVVILTGLRAVDYRGTWVEDLAGVRIGETDVTNGYDLATATMPEGQRAGARPERQCVVATLTPAEDGIRTLGTGRVLATERTLGAGRVYTLAVDATGHVLQDTPGFRTLWRSMIADRRSGPLLNTDLFATTLSNVLPSLSGVTIRPLSWVMTYLLLYVGVGVVGNWLFWNARKRREIAWFCLLIISVGFSLFAMVSGRAGWSSSAEMQQVDVLHLRPNENRADYIGMYGILTARTRQYEAELTEDSMLVRDGLTTSTGTLRTMGVTGAVGTTVPFRWVQGDEPSLERLRVGASELRLLQIEGRVAVEGTIESNLVVDEVGIRGTIENGTDLPLRSPMLFYRGRFAPLSPTEAGWRIDQTHEEMVRQAAQRNVQPQSLMYGAYWAAEQSIERMRQVGQYALFSDDALGLATYSQPYFLAWASGTQYSVLEIPEVVKSEIAETLVVAPLFPEGIENLEGKLMVQIQDNNGRGTVQPHIGYHAFYPSLRLRIESPPLRESMRPGTIALTVLARNAPRGHDLRLARVDPENPYATDFSDDNMIAPVSQRAERDGQGTTRFEYRIDDWRSLRVDARSNALALDLVWTRTRGDDWNRQYGEVYVAAEYIGGEPLATEGVWPQWQ